MMCRHSLARGCLDLGSEVGGSARRRCPAAPSSKPIRTPMANGGALVAWCEIQTPSAFTRLVKP
jgi:hypothetical protein